MGFPVLWKSHFKISISAFGPFFMTSVNSNMASMNPNHAYVKLRQKNIHKVSSFTAISKTRLTAKYTGPYVDIKALFFSSGDEDSAAQPL